MRDSHACSRLMQKIQMYRMRRLCWQHTAGSLFKKYSPVKHSIYGNRFLTGWKENSKGTPIIITNGLGTSRVDVRLFTPSEVVLVVLHRVEKQKE